MIQNYSDLERQILLVNKVIKNCSPIQKIFSTSRYISFSLRAPGKTYWVYLGRGKGFEGVWLSEKPPVSALRSQDKLLQYLRRHLTGNLVESLSIDKLDRIVYLNTIKMKKKSNFGLFYRGRLSYFSHCFEDSFTSWRGKVSYTELSELFNEVGRSEIEKRESLKEIESIEKLLEKEQTESLKNPILSKKKKFKARKLKNIQGDLEKVLKWSEIEKKVTSWQEQKALGEDTELDSFKARTKIAGIKFNFIGVSSFYKKVDLIFYKIKRLKKSERFLKERLEKTKESSLELTEEGNNLKTISPVWKDESAKKIKVKENFKFHEFKTEHGILRVGKDAVSNDYLRSSWAKKDDWWFHLENVPSAHGYLKSDSLASLDPLFINKVGCSLKNLSDSESSTVIYTQVKNLKGLKSKAGSVRFKKEKRISFQYSDEWLSVFSKVDLS